MGSRLVITLRVGLVFSVVAALLACDGDSTPSSHDAGATGDAAVTADPGATSDASAAADASQSDAGAASDAATPWQADASAEPGACTPSSLGRSIVDLIAEGRAESLGELGLMRVAFTARGDFYYTRDGVGLARIRAGGSQSELLVARDAVDRPNWAAVSDTHLYYLDSAQDIMMRVPLASPGATPEQQGGAVRRGVSRVIRGDVFYGRDESLRDSQVWRQDFKSGELAVLATGEARFGGIDVADGHVFYSGASNLFRVPVEGGTPQALDDREHVEPGPVLATAGALYWADGDQLWVSDPTSNDAATATQPFARYAPPSVLPGPRVRRASQLGEHGNRIYWLDDEGVLSWATKDRTTCGTMAVFSFTLGPIVAWGDGFAFAPIEGELYRITLE